MRNEVAFHHIETNGITLHTATAGPEDGPMVLLLHGFPEFWYGWRKQIEPIVEAGYKVVVPDQRGYNVSEKPEGAENYTIEKLRDDMTGLIEAFGRDRAVVIGHDWGGAVAWFMAATKPEYVEKLVTINIPHLAAMKDVILRYPPQMAKSLYILFFQLPNLPEKLMGENLKYMKQGIAASAKHGAFTEEDLTRYAEAWSEPAALISMLNWYRAMGRSRGGSTGGNVEVPVRMIWGLGDPFLDKKTAKASLNYCTQGELIFVDEATHWVHHEQPKIVNRLIKEFLGK